MKLEIAAVQRKLDRMAVGGDLLHDALANDDFALCCVRDLSHLLHPSALDDPGLVAALEWHLAEFRKHHDTAVMFVHDGMHGRQSPEIERAVYRIMQERSLTSRVTRTPASLVSVSAQSAEPFAW